MYQEKPFYNNLSEKNIRNFNFYIGSLLLPVSASHPSPVAPTELHSHLLHPALEGEKYNCCTLLYCTALYCTVLYLIFPNPSSHCPQVLPMYFFLHRHCPENKFNKSLEIRGCVKLLFTDMSANFL